MKNLFQVILEAQQSDQPTQAELEQYREKLQASKTSIPRSIAAIKPHLFNTGEYELYEFIENCEFWKVQNKNGPGWHATAGVRVGSNKIEFYYDEEFLDKLAKKPGQLIFLIGHEASHILRFHIDRSVAANQEASLANVAQDMIINDDILLTDKVAGWKPEMITKSTVMELAKGEKDGAFAHSIPDKFRQDFKEVGRKAYYSENMYNWLNANPKEKEKVTGPGAPQEVDYFEKGSLVKVNSGPHKGEYRRITEVNKDGTYETEPVDIQAEIEKVKGK
jgi:hypothetical protein